MSLFRLPKLRFAPSIECARDLFARGKGKPASERAFRRLQIDPLEERRLLSLSNLAVMTAGDHMVNQQLITPHFDEEDFDSPIELTEAGHSVACDNDGDFVVTWTRYDDVLGNTIDPETGELVTDANVYARYFTDEVQRMTLPDGVLDDADPRKYATFDLSVGGNEVQKITVSSTYEPAIGFGGLLGTYVSGQFQLEFGASTTADIPYNEVSWLNNPLATTFQGYWDANTNAVPPFLPPPALPTGFDLPGDYYIVSTADGVGGTVLDGIDVWEVGDWALYDGTGWVRFLAADVANPPTPLEHIQAQADIIQTELRAISGAEPELAGVTVEALNPHEFLVNFGPASGGQDMPLLTVNTDPLIPTPQFVSGFLPAVMTSTVSEPIVLPDIPVHPTDPHITALAIEQHFLLTSENVPIGPIDLPPSDRIDVLDFDLPPYSVPERLRTPSPKVDVAPFVDPATGLPSNTIFDITFIGDSGMQDHPQLVLSKVVDETGEPGGVLRDITVPLPNPWVPAVTTVKQPSPEFRVNPVEVENEFTLRVDVYNQTNPSVGMDADGNFVIAWDSEIPNWDNYGSVSDIFAQRFRPTGEVTAPWFYSPVRSNLRSVRYMWQPSGAGTNEYYVTLPGGEDPSLNRPSDLLIEGAPAPEVDYGLSGLGSLAAGEWGWGDNDGLGFDTVYVRLDEPVLFSPNAHAAGHVTMIHQVAITQVDKEGDSFQVNSFTPNAQRAPHVDMDHAGNFMVVWENEGQDISFFNGITARSFDRHGVSQGLEFMVHPEDTAVHFEPYVAMSGDGHAAITWTRTHDPHLLDPGPLEVEVWATVLPPDYDPTDPDQAPLIPAQNIVGGGSSTAAFDYQNNVCFSFEAAQDPDNLPETSEGVYGLMYELYDADGVAIPGGNVVRTEFRANSADTVGANTLWPYDQESSNVMMDADGDVAISYHGYGGDMAEDVELSYDEYNLVYEYWMEQIWGPDLIPNTADDLNLDLGNPPLLAPWEDPYFNPTVDTFMFGEYTEGDVIKNNTLYSSLGSDIDAAIDYVLFSAASPLLHPGPNLIPFDDPLTLFIDESADNTVADNEQLGRLGAILDNGVRMLRGDANGAMFSRWDADPRLETNNLFSDSLISNMRDGHNERYIITIPEDADSGSFTIRVWNDMLLQSRDVTITPVYDNGILQPYATAGEIDEQLQTQAIDILGVNWPEAYPRYEGPVDVRYIGGGGGFFSTELDIREGTYWDLYPMMLNPLDHVFEVTFQGEVHDHPLTMAVLDGGGGMTYTIPAVDERQFITVTVVPIEDPLNPGTFIWDWGWFGLTDGTMTDGVPNYGSSDVNWIAGGDPDFVYAPGIADGIQSITNGNYEVDVAYQPLMSDPLTPTSGHLPYDPSDPTDPNWGNNPFWVFQVDFVGGSAATDIPPISGGAAQNQPPPPPDWDPFEGTINGSTFRNGHPESTNDAGSAWAFEHTMGTAGTWQGEVACDMEPDGDFVAVWSQLDLASHQELTIPGAVDATSPHASVFYRRFDETTDTAGPRVADMVDQEGNLVDDGGTALNLDTSVVPPGSDPLQYLVLTFDEQMLQFDYDDVEWAQDQRTALNLAGQPVPESIRILLDSVNNEENYQLLVGGSPMAGGVVSVRFGMNMASQLMGNDPATGLPYIDPNTGAPYDLDATPTNKWEAVLLLDGNPATTSMGTWNAETNIPNLLGLSPSPGDYYIVAGVLLPGGANFDLDGDGTAETWNNGDWALFNGTDWVQILAAAAGPAIEPLATGAYGIRALAPPTDPINDPRGGLRDRVRNPLGRNGFEPNGVDWERTFSVVADDVGGGPGPGPDPDPEPDTSGDSVNTTTDGFQDSPAVANDQAGDHVVVWVSYEEVTLADATTALEASIKGQMFARNGEPVGDEFDVATFTTGDQIEPDVAMSDAGRFVVVWSGQGEDDGSGVFARIYDEFGAATGDQFRVNQNPWFIQDKPAVTMNRANGSFVVSYTTYGAPEGDINVLARRFDVLGNALGDEFMVNTTTYSSQDRSDVAMDAVGNFVVVWNSWLVDQGYWSVCGQRYSAAGVPLGGEFQINQEAVDDQGFDDLVPQVARDAAGNFVVTWSSFMQPPDGNQYGVFARRYNAAGAPLGGEFLVNETTLYSQYQSGVGMDTDGKFAITWASFGQDALEPGDLDFGVFARVYDATGADWGWGEFRVNSTIFGNQHWPAVAMGPSGDIDIVWVGPDEAFQGEWDANANTPVLASGIGTPGEYYIVDVAGTTDLDGIATWEVGDWAVFDGATSMWTQILAADADDIGTDIFSGIVPTEAPIIPPASDAVVEDPNVQLYGTNGNDVFEFIAGSIPAAWTATINGVSQEINPSATSLDFDGVGGNDTVVLTATDGLDFLELWSDHATLTFLGYPVTVANVESVTVHGLFGKDVAYLYDSAGDDQFVASPGEASMIMPGATHSIDGFEKIIATAGNGGADTAGLYDSPGNDLFIAAPDYGRLTGSGFSLQAVAFPEVSAYATGGGRDVARMYDSPGDDIFYSTPVESTMYQAGGADPFLNRAKYFEEVLGFTPAGGHDVSYLFDSAGDDTFYAGPDEGAMYGSTGGGMLGNQEYFNRAKEFEEIHADAPGGGTDEARLYDSAGDDHFYGSPLESAMYGAGYYNEAKSFEKVYADASTGGNDRADLFDSNQVDLLEAATDWARLSNASLNFLYEVLAFDQVNAAATTSGDTKDVTEPLDYLLGLQGPWQDL